MKRSSAGVAAVAVVLALLTAGCSDSGDRERKRKQSDEPPPAAADAQAGGQESRAPSPRTGTGSDGETVQGQESTGDDPDPAQSAGPRGHAVNPLEDDDRVQAASTREFCAAVDSLAAAQDPLAAAEAMEPLSAAAPRPLRVSVALYAESIERRVAMFGDGGPAAADAEEWLAQNAAAVRAAKAAVDSYAARTCASG